MLRAQLSRRALLGVAAVATVITETPREKLSIYSAPEPKLILIDTPSELERRIGDAREKLTSTYSDSYAYVQSWVDRWIAIEHAVENRIKSFKAPEENLTPGVLYVGVATLSGSILARSRGLPSRLFLPPALFLFSLNHFLPRTSSSIGEYISSLEHTYAPRAAQFTDTAVAHSIMTWEMAKDKANDGRKTAESAIIRAVGSIQDATGLKLREALGATQGAEAQGKEVIKAAEEKAKEALVKTEAAVEKKVEEVKRLV